MTPFTSLYDECGVKLFHIDATATEDIYHPHLRAWVSSGRFDYSAQETHWRELVRRCPDAKLCLRLYVASPPWWDASHPDELQRYEDGSTEGAFQRTERRTLPSLASEKWKRDAVKAVKRFTAWLHSSGWEPRVWGIMLSYGITWEWGILGSDKFPDYSDPMQRYFRSWLRKQYRNDERFARSWGEPGMKICDAEVPSVKERVSATGDFRIFPRDRASYDYQKCLSDANAEYLLVLAGAVREKAKAKYKVGAFYGYTLTAREHNQFTATYGAGGLQGGHHAFHRILKSGLLDFIASPYAYADRDLGTGTLIHHFPLASVRAHGMHAYAENDLWTFTNPSAFEGKISIGQTHTRRDSISHQRLAVAQALCCNSSYWWTELTEWIGPYALNYSDPALLNEMKKHVGLLRERTARQIEKFETRAEIALVLDEEAIDAVSLRSRLFCEEVYEKLGAWAWCGAPFDIWLASDFGKRAAKQYKLVYVFAPYLTDKRRQAIASALCCDQRTVWWGPYTGWLTETGPSSAAFNGLTGFKSTALHEKPNKRSARKNWYSIYGPAKQMTPTDMFAVAKKAGVAMYVTEPAHVMAGGGWISIHVRRAGVYTLNLPAGAWVDIFTGREATSPYWTFEENQVALFREKGAN